MKDLMTRWLGVALVACAVGCGGPDNSLRGSIDQSFSLDFDEVRIRKQGTDLLIEYLKNVGATPAKVCKVIIKTENLTGLKSNSKIEGDQFLEYVRIQREAQTQGDFPALQSGQVVLDEFEFKDGGTIAGEFEGFFVNGRTISGTYEGKVDEISLE